MITPRPSLSSLPTVAGNPTPKRLEMPLTPTEIETTPTPVERFDTLVPSQGVMDMGTTPSPAPTPPPPTPREEPLALASSHAEPTPAPAIHAEYPDSFMHDSQIDPPEEEPMPPADMPEILAPPSEPEIPVSENPPQMEGTIYTDGTLEES